MFGASLLKLLKFGFVFTGIEAAILLIGMTSAFIVSVFVIRFLMDYIKKHDFQAFGWYRIILGLIVLLLNICGIIQVWDHNRPNNSILFGRLFNVCWLQNP